MRIVIAEKDCSGCYACVNACPKNCISMQEDADGFWYPVIDGEKCVECGLCKASCPALKVREEKALPTAFAVKNKDDAIRQESSSGGVFSLLADWVLEQNGVVFGARLSADCREVYHVCIETKQDLALLRGSKYVQSRVGLCHKQAKALLEEGRTVLFTGTPCQVEGLKTFLKKDYRNLICADIICHGVPSGKVWKSYVDACEKRAGAKMVEAGFRNKRKGWKGFQLVTRFEDGTTSGCARSQDPFMRAFLRNACLRPSCYQCHYKTASRVADITLADFWGIEQICPEMDDDRGTSLVLIHTEKGEALMKTLAGRMEQKAVNAEKAVALNPAATQSVTRHPNGRLFMDALEEMSIFEAAERFLIVKVSLRSAVIEVLEKLGLVRIIKRILGRE